MIHDFRDWGFQALGTGHMIRSLLFRAQGVVCRIKGAKFGGWGLEFND